MRVAQQTHDFELVAIADPQLLSATAAALGLPLQLKQCQLDIAPVATQAGQLSVLPVELAAPVVPGKLNVDNADYVLKTLKTAAELCLSQSCDAIVTGPVQKSIINEAGMPFSGHTEFFAQHAGVEKVVMLLAEDDFRVALATTHLPLKDVSAAINETLLNQVIRILMTELHSKFGIDKPRVLVCGLNPHAGENGHLGMEEIDIIEPALARLRTQGYDLVGPLPADTLFTPRHLDHADAVLAMYHDQGLPVLKHAGFGKAVNITLGLPYIRTSVDHGTALSLAGKGTADAGSLQAALAQAHRLCCQRHKDH